MNIGKFREKYGHQTHRKFNDFITTLDSIFGRDIKKWPIKCTGVDRVIKDNFKQIRIYTEEKD